MCKYITFLAVFFLGIQVSHSQVTLDIGDVTTDCSNAINLPVTVTNFNSIVGVQFTIEWDESQLQFVNINSLNGTLGLAASNFNTTIAGTGSITFAWFSSSNPTGFNLNNGTALFNIRFIPLGPVGTNTPVIFSSSITSQEVVIPPFTAVNASWFNGSVTVGDTNVPEINCPSAVNIQAPQGATNVTVTGLTPTFSDDCGTPSIAYNITGVTSGNGSNTANGTNFNIGNSVVTYTATDAGGNTATCAVNVTITASFVEDPLVITAGSANVVCGQQLVLPVMVTSGFTDILSFQFGMTYDPSILQFTGINGLATLPNYDNTAFLTGQANSGLLGVVWDDDDDSGQSLGNGTVLFNLLFNVIPGVENGSSMTIGNANIIFNATAPGNPPTAVPTQGIPGIVVLVDNTNPVVMCPSNVVVDAGGASSIVVNNINASTSDACGAVQLSYNISGSTGANGSNNASGSSFNVGVSTVTYTATDINSNTSSCSFNVTVTSTNPVLTLIAESEIIQCNGEFGITVTVNGFTQLTSLQFSMNWDGNVIDYNNIGALANLPGLNLNSFGTANAENGTITFSWFDPDLSGETLAPGTTLFTIFFLGDGGYGQSTNISFTSNPVTIESSGTGFPPVEVDVNTSNGLVQITDSAPPIVVCPSDITIAAPNGSSSIVLNDLDPTVNDNCAISNVSYNTTGATILNGNDDISGLPFNIGNTNIVYTATDIAGLSSSCNFDILVLNSGVLTLNLTPQNASCGESMVIPVSVDNFTDVNSLQFTIEWNENIIDFNGISDIITLQGLNNANFGIAQVNNGLMTFSWSDPDLTGESLPIGSVLFNLNFTVIGNSLDATNISFVNVPTPIEAVTAGFPPQSIAVDLNNTTVSVIDNTLPEITCPQDITVQAALSETFVVVNNITPQATDNCAVSGITYASAGASFLNGNNDASGNPFNLGTTLVTYFASDDAGNTNSCSFLVTVNAPEVLTLIAGSGTEECGSEFDLDISVDNFNDIANIQFTVHWDPAVLSFANVNNLNAALGIQNSNFGFAQTGIGNLTFSWFGLPGVTLNDGSDLFSIHFTAISSSNTSITFTNSPVTIEASQEGFPPTPVTVLTNTGFVNIVDTQAPDVISCPTDITVNAFAGTCNATASWSEPVFDDNCDDALTITSNVNSGSNFTGGTSPVTYTATDDDGNSAQCNFNVIVVDTQVPVWTNCPPDISTDLPPDTCSAIVLWPAPTATDNCDLSLTITSSHTIGTQFFVGNTTVTYTAVDDAGNSAICSFNVILSDTVNPVITCPLNITTQVAPDVCQVVITWDPPVASDNCSLAGVVSNVASGSVFIPGVYNVVYTATDAYANSAECSFTVTVQDVTPPVVVSCPVNDTFPATGNQCTGIATWTLPSFTDNCDQSLDITSTHSSGNEFPVGTVTVIYTATDNSGNTSTCSFSVTVSDQDAPTLVNCPSDITVNNGIDSCAAAVFFDNAIFTDLCDNDLLLTASATSGSAFNVGLTTVVFTATDDAGNSSNCSFEIRVGDNQFPVVIDCPPSISVDGDPGQCGANVSWPAPTATDNCPGLILNTASSNGGFYPVGTSTILYTATDAALNSTPCEFTITVNGSTMVTVTGCPDDITIAENLPGCAAIATWTDPVITGDCNDPNFNVVQTHTSGSVFQLGTTPVVYTVFTQSGSSEACVFDVVVEDTLAPVVTFCSNNVIVNTQDCSSTVDWAPATGTDNCSAVTISSNFQIGNELPVGTTHIIYTLLDESGNLSLCEFDVIIIEASLPTFDICPVDFTVSVDENCQGIATWSEPVANDNCSGVTLIGTHVSGDVFPIGTTEVTYTATDIAGNQAFCTFNVTVEDPEAPEFTFCPGDQTFNANLPGCEALAAWLEPVFSDNCGINNLTLVQSHFSGTPFPLGTTEVTYTITDMSLNQATCVFNILVEDNFPPVVTFCPDDITVQAVNCMAIADFQAAEATDNCGTINTITNVNPGDIISVGVTNVVYSFFDTEGNLAICNFQITVEENDLPFFVSCPSSFTVPGDLNCEAVVLWDDPVAADLCSDPVLTSNFVPGDVFGAGSTLVIYTATDAAGNTDLCSFVVTVSGGALAIDCPDNVLALTPSDVCTALAFWPDPDLLGNCDLTGSFTSDFNSGEIFPVGSTTVTYNATNAQGDNAACSFTVLVLDTAPPVIDVCPDDITLSTTASECTVPADYILPTAIDNCSSELINTANIEPGDLLPVGCHDITINIADESGNANECFFQICVEDQIAPIITCPQPVVVETNGTILSDPDNILIAINPVSCDTVQINFPSPVGLDNCQNATTLQSDNSGLSSGSDFATGNYILSYTVTDASGNTSSCLFNITVMATNVVVQPVASDNPVCIPADITINVPGTTGDYTWTAPDGTTSTDENLVIVDFNINDTGTYQVSIVLANGCVATGSIELFSGAAVQIEASSNGLSCVPEDLQLTATGIAGNPTSWTWTGPNMFSSSAQDTSILLADNTAAGTYILTGCNDDGCCSQVELVVEPVQDLGLPLIQATDLVICQGDFTTLTATDYPGATYSWSATSTSTAGLPADTETNPITVTPTGAGIYTYFVTAVAGACVSEEASIFITVLANPVITLSSNTPLNCTDGTESLQLFETGGVAMFWTWTGPNASNVQNPVFPNVTSADAGWYFVDIEDAFGCKASDSILIEITEIPAAPEPFTDGIACLGGTLQLFVDNLPQGTEFAWSGPNGFESNEELPVVTDNIQPFHAGDYVLVVTVNGCESPVSDPVTVTVLTAPIAVTDHYDILDSEIPTLDILANDTISGGSSNVGITITNQPFNGTASVDNDQNTIVYDPNEGYNGGETFSYQICYNECPEVCSETIVMITVTGFCLVPTIITPNGDGLNDQLFIPCLESGKFPASEIVIYNEWGDEVYRAAPYNNDWEGTFNDKPLPDGTYFYTFREDQAAEWTKGFVTIYR